MSKSFGTPDVEYLIGSRIRSRTRIPEYTGTSGNVIFCPPILPRNPRDYREENIAAVAEAGYDGVDLTLDENGALVDPAIREDLIRRTEEHGLSIPSVHTITFWNYPLTSTEEETWNEGIKQATRFVGAADDIGADVALVVPGAVDESTPYDVATRTPSIRCTNWRRWPPTTT